MAAGRTCVRSWRTLWVLLVGGCTAAAPADRGPVVESAELGGPPPSCVASVLEPEDNGPLPLKLRVRDPALLEVLVRDVALDPDRPSPCVLEIGPVEMASARLQRLDRRRVVGAREVGRRRVEASPPPRSEEEPLPRIRLQRTGEPELDLLGGVVELVLEGLARLKGPPAEEAAARTVRWREEPVFESYGYELRRYRAWKRGRVRVRLRSWDGEVVREAWVPFRKTGVVGLAIGRDPGDPELPAEVDWLVESREALRAWRNTPPEIRIGELIEALREGVQQEPAGMAQAEADPSRAAAQPRPELVPHPSVVRLEGEDAVLGFYVTPELVLLPARALPESSLVPLRFARDRTTLGLVETVDDLEELALVWVPRRGSPLPLAGDSPEPPGEEGPFRYLVPAFEPELLPGAPLVAGETVIGVLLDPNTPPVALATARRIRALLARLDAGAPGG